MNGNNDPTQLSHQPQQQQQIGGLPGLQHHHLQQQQQHQVHQTQHTHQHSPGGHSGGYGGVGGGYDYSTGGNSMGPPPPLNTNVGAANAANQESPYAAFPSSGARGYSPNSSIHPNESASNVGNTQNIAQAQALALAKAQAQIRSRQNQMLNTIPETPQQQQQQQQPIQQQQQQQHQLPMSMMPMPSMPLPFQMNSYSQQTTQSVQQQQDYNAYQQQIPQQQQQQPDLQSFALPNPQFTNTPATQQQFQPSQFYPLDSQPLPSLPLPSTQDFSLSSYGQPQPQQQQQQFSHLNSNPLPLSSGLLSLANQVAPNQMIPSLSSPAALSYQPQQHHQQQNIVNNGAMDVLAENPSERWKTFMGNNRDEDDDDDDVSNGMGGPSVLMQQQHQQQHQQQQQQQQQHGYGSVPGSGGYNSQAPYFMNGTDSFQQPQQYQPQVDGSTGDSDVGTPGSYGSVSFYPKGSSMQSRAPPRLKYTSMPYSYDAPYSARRQESRQFHDDPHSNTPQSQVANNFALLSVIDDIKKDTAFREYGMQQQQQQQQPQQYQQQYQQHPQQTYPPPPPIHGYDEDNSSALSMNSQSSYHPQYSHPGTSGTSPTMSSLSNPNLPTGSHLSSTVPGSSSSSGGGGGGAKGHFVCTEPNCGKVFDRAQKLKSHAVSHKADRPFICGYCNLAFQRNHDLTRHMRLHTNEKPHKCMANGCQKSFMRADALKRHCKMDHGDI
ncbi:UNVERIFIED_CONTAM: hypothetical protein HDU68_001993 [Siphonaria sp. JEL0065]|nr:hypothetical protein HDU68_001993 [Siphonaria sp. JEL0065]